MLTDIRSDARQSRYLLRKWASDPAVHKGVRITQCLLTGFLLSAAGLGQYMQPLVMGPVLAADPWCAVLTALGGKAEADEDTLTVFGTGFVGGTVDSMNDHRIAMSAAIAATVCTMPVTILGAECVEKSYPKFWAEFARLGGQYELNLR